MAWLTDPYAYDFMQRALAAVLLVGALAPAVGVWIVLRRMSYLGDAMSHATLGGVALAYVAGVSITVGALAAGLLMAALITVLGVLPRLREDAIIGVAEVALFAAGLLVIAKADTGAVELSHILLGSVTTVSPADLRFDAALAAITGIVLVAGFDDLRAATMDPEHARTVGVPLVAVRGVLLAVLASVVVLSLQTVGLLLAIALLVVPAATARLWTATVLRMTFVAMAIGISCCVVGLTVSWHADAPPGATIALLTVAVMLVSAALRLPRRAAPVAAHLDP
jgi:ABC-type Mn2+/Zn2+ transport system permease subunit